MWDDHPFFQSIHFFKASIPPGRRFSMHPFLQIILVQNSDCSKESIPSPNQQRRPLPSLLFSSFFYAHEASVHFDIPKFVSPMCFFCTLPSGRVRMKLFVGQLSHILYICLLQKNRCFHTSLALSKDCKSCR